MKLLFRYIVVQNILYVFIFLAIGVSIYVLVDLFDRIDNFIDAGLPILHCIWFYTLKVPVMAAQILGPCFFLATLVQLCIMARSRELVALQSCGVSFVTIAFILLCCGSFFAVAQFAFSQFVGIKAERSAQRIWAEQVQKRQSSNFQVKNIWFEDGGYKVRLDVLFPHTGEGQGFVAYKRSNGSSLEHVIRADRIKAEPGAWRLFRATHYNIQEFGNIVVEEMVLPLQASPRTFEWYDAKVEKITLPLWELSKAIDAQQAAGSNVESLRTAWHMKLSGAASLILLALAAVALITWRDSIYVCIALGLVLIFFLFVLTSLSPSLGQHDIMSPFWAAWFPNLILLCAAMSRLVWFHWPHRFKEAVPLAGAGA